MDISTLLSGAGQVSTGVREREADLRRAREEQLALEALNRQNRLRREMTTAPMPEVGQMDPFPAQRPDLPGAPAPAPAAAPAAPKAGVQINRPPAVPLNTVGGVEAIRNNPKLSLTREQFLALPKAEQQRIYEASLPKNMGGGTTVIRAPLKGGLGTARAMVASPATTYDTPTGTAPKAPTFDEYVAGLPQQRSPGGSTRGRPKKAGVAAPGGNQYDKPTKYDALIQQAAEQNGLDAAIFKRLLGTESSFNPNAVSPRGKSYGLGIGQIADVHGLSDAQRLDPNIAIPAAAQIFARYLNAAGGNYEEAMMKYKGAVSEKGRASMAPIIASILNGLSPVGTAQAADMPAPVATLAANDGPALREAVAAAGAAPGVAPRPQAGQRPTQPTYSPDPQATSQAMRIAMQQRDELVRMAGMYQRAGMGQEYMQARQQIMALDNSMVDIAGMHGISEMELTGSTARLAQAWSMKVGVPIELQRRQDNTYDILVNGRPEAQYVPAGEVMDTALSIFDPQYRERKGAWADKEHEARLKINEVMAGKTGDMIKELYVAQQKGVLDKELEWMKMNMGWEIKGPAGDGTYLIKPPGDTPFYFDPAGGEIEIDGVKVPVTGARRVGGLSTPAGR